MLEIRACPDHCTLSLQAPPSSFLAVLGRTPLSQRPRPSTIYHRNIRCTRVWLIHWERFRLCLCMVLRIRCMRPCARFVTPSDMHSRSTHPVVFFSMLKPSMAQSPPPLMPGMLGYIRMVHVWMDVVLLHVRCPHVHDACDCYARTPLALKGHVGALFRNKSSLKCYCLLTRWCLSFHYNTCRVPVRPAVAAGRMAATSRVHPQPPLLSDMRHTDKGEDACRYKVFVRCTACPRSGFNNYQQRTC